MIEASYVQADPPLLAHLAEERNPWMVDPQSVRFASSGYRQIARMRALPYAPDALIDPGRFSKSLERMVRGAIEFQAQAEPSMYLVPALPLSRASAAVFRTFARIDEFAADLNGKDVPYRPIVAAAYPSAEVLRGRFSVFERLDRPFAGAYVLPLQLNPRRDSVERLVAYARFLEHAQGLGLRVVAGRAGVFGLVLAAFGIENFDSGLGERESFSLMRLTKVRRVEPGGKRSGGRQRRVYVASLRSTFEWDEVNMLLETRALRAQLTCNLGKQCRFGGYRYALEHPREHFFHARAAELEALRGRRTTDLRVQLVMQWLKTAIDTGRLVNRVREEQQTRPLDFGAPRDLASRCNEGGHGYRRARGMTSLPVRSQAVRRLGEAMTRTSIDASGVARILDKDPKTVLRWLREDTVPRWDTRELLLALDVVLERLAEVIQPEAAEEWLFTPVPALDYERPVDLVRTGAYRRVLALIDGLGEGVFA